jgi:pimeloyl-ACP methyl ester carboxylesterase
VGDDATTWLSVADRLSKRGIRTVMPWLRGFGETRFKSSSTYRDGCTEALAQDALELMNALEVERFSVIGHDWGARVAYALAALIPEQLDTITAISLGYSPRGAFPVPPFDQSRAWWYQWFMSVDAGAEAVAKDPKGFARIQWDTWSPPGWFNEATFQTVARSFENPDWLAIQGAVDGTLLVNSTEGKERFFTDRYQRVVLDGVDRYLRGSLTTSMGSSV